MFILIQFSSEFEKFMSLSHILKTGVVSNETKKKIKQW